MTDKPANPAQPPGQPPDPPPIDAHAWVISPFVEIEAHARADVQAALDSTHRFCEGVDARDAVAMLREVDRLRLVLRKIMDCKPCDEYDGCVNMRAAAKDALGGAVVTNDDANRLRELLGRLKEALRVPDWRSLEIDDPALVRAVDAAIAGRR